MSVIALTKVAEDEVGISENYQTISLHCTSEVNNMARNLRNYEDDNNYK